MTDRFGSAAESSHAWAALDAVGVLVADSRLYRWWVTPSDPRALRIDLGDSRFVGPIARTIVAARASFERSWTGSRAGRAWRTVADWIGRSPVRLVSAGLLVVVLASVIAATRRPTPIGGGELAILAGLSLLGLREGRSWSELRETRAGRAIGAVFAPASDDAQSLSDRAHPPSDEEQR